MILQHYGNFGAVVDFDWNEFDTWSIVTTTDDIKSTENSEGSL